MCHLAKQEKRYESPIEKFYLLKFGFLVAGLWIEGFE
jgi:hypothetical protein